MPAVVVIVEKVHKSVDLSYSVIVARLPRGLALDLHVCIGATDRDVHVFYRFPNQCVAGIGHPCSRRNQNGGFLCLGNMEPLITNSRFCCRPFCNVEQFSESVQVIPLGPARNILVAV